MKAQCSSIYLNESPNKSAIVKGFSWLIELGNNNVNKRSALLAVPVKSNLQGDIISVIGDTAEKRLRKGEMVTVKSTVQLSLLTERQTIYSWNGPILAIYPTKKLLDKIDGLKEVTDVLVIPWTLEEVQYWIDTWSAIELGTTPKATTSKIISNPIVEAALKSLTHRVNLSTGIIHPSDRSATIGLFRHLHNAGISYDPTEVRAWLLSQGGWNPKGADDVMKIAVDILTGKRLHGGHDSWGDNILEIWEDNAKK